MTYCRLANANAVLCVAAVAVPAPLQIGSLTGREACYLSSAHGSHICTLWLNLLVILRPIWPISGDIHCEVLQR